MIKEIDLVEADFDKYIDYIDNLDQFTRNRYFFFAMHKALDERRLRDYLCIQTKTKPLEENADKSTRINTAGAFANANFVEFGTVL